MQTKHKLFHEGWYFFCRLLKLLICKFLDFFNEFKQKKGKTVIAVGVVPGPDFFLLQAVSDCQKAFGLQQL
jgi:hypothetical protein